MKRAVACAVGLSWLASSSFSASAAAEPRSWPGLASKQAQREDEDEPEVERLSREQLRQRLPALRTRGEPRVVQGSLGFGIRFYYLPLSVEGTLDLYPLPLLRVGLVYAVGLGIKWDGTQATGTFAQYAEAMAGVRLWGRASEVDADLQLRRSIGGYGEALPSVLRPRRGDFAEVLPVWLPSSHQLFAEAGALTGYTGLLECASGCGGARAEREYRSLARQVLIPFAGLRYVYYSEALNAKPSVNRVRYGQLYAHVLLHAFNQPSPDAYFWNGDRVQRSPVGFRVGGEIPASPFCLVALLGQGCAQAGVGVGYTPYPAFASVDFHLRFAIR
ncbi:MAG: hypothetical protein EOO73_12675 [Myxococcales bacterium]|nr:MAG: hypothetical protein EOO73_12675 [Myxococcales bacterium]